MRCWLKTDSDGAEMTLDGNSFHRLAPNTGNARLPTVVRQNVGSTIRRLVEADLVVVIVVVVAVVDYSSSKECFFKFTIKCYKPK